VVACAPTPIDLPPAALPPTPGGRLRKFTFDAGVDGETVPLGSLVPVASVRGIATVRGPNGYRSYAAPINPADPETLWQWYDETGEPFGPAVAPLNFPNTVSGGTP
jgi:hypothetical protein